MTWWLFLVGVCPIYILYCGGFDYYFILMFVDLGVRLFGISLLVYGLSDCLICFMLVIVGDFGVLDKLVTCGFFWF